MENTAESLRLQYCASCGVEIQPIHYLASSSTNLNTNPQNPSVVYCINPTLSENQTHSSFTISGVLCKSCITTTFQSNSLTLSQNLRIIPQLNRNNTTNQDEINNIIDDDTVKSDDDQINDINNTNGISTCSICLDELTSNGRHRVVSLKCGHVFGKHCVMQWITQVQRCPTCNKKSIRSDIRPVFGLGKLQVLDTTELESVKKQLMSAKQKAASSQAREKRLELALKSSILHSEVLNNRTSNRNPQESVQNAQNHTESGTESGDWRNILQKSVDVSLKLDVKRGGRCLEIDSHQGGSIIFSRAFDIGAINRGFVLNRVSISSGRVEVSSHRVLHSKQIRDLQICPHESSVAARTIASVGEDKRLVISNIENGFSVGIFYELEEKGCSVTWLSNPNHIAVGQEKATVQLFDLRNTKCSLDSISFAQNVSNYSQHLIYSPVHSINWNPNSATLYASTHNTLIQWNIHPILASHPLRNPKHIQTFPQNAYLHSFSMISSTSTRRPLSSLLSFRNLHATSSLFLHQNPFTLVESITTPTSLSKHSNLLGTPPCSSTGVALVGHESRTVLSRTSGVNFGNNFEGVTVGKLLLSSSSGGCNRGGVTVEEDGTTVVAAGDELSRKVCMWKLNASDLDDACDADRVHGGSGTEEMDENDEETLFWKRFSTVHGMLLPESHSELILDVKLSTKFGICASISSNSLLVHRIPFQSLI